MKLWEGVAVFGVIVVASVATGGIAAAAGLATWGAVAVGGLVYASAGVATRVSNDIHESNKKELKRENCRALREIERLTHERIALKSEHSSTALYLSALKKEKAAYDALCQQQKEEIKQYVTTIEEQQVQLQKEINKAYDTIEKQSHTYQSDYQPRFSNTHLANSTSRYTAG